MLFHIQLDGSWMFALFKSESRFTQVRETLIHIITGTTDGDENFGRPWSWKRAACERDCVIITWVSIRAAGIGRPDAPLREFKVSNRFAPSAEILAASDARVSESIERGRHAITSSPSCRAGLPLAFGSASRLSARNLPPADRYRSRLW